MKAIPMEGRRALEKSLRFYSKLLNNRRVRNIRWPILEYVSSLYVCEMMTATLGEFHPQRKFFEREKYDTLEELDKFLIGYTLVAVAGEVRYAIQRHDADSRRDSCNSDSTGMAHTKPKGDAPPAKDIISNLNALGFDYTVYTNRADHRNTVHEAALRAKPIKFNAILQNLKKLFSDYMWEKGYGGDVWEAIFLTLLGRLEGDYDQLAFVDRCLDLEHNNGCYLDKTITIYDRHYNCLKMVLDEKRDACSIDQLPFCVALSSSTLRPSVMRHLSPETVQKIDFITHEWKIIEEHKSAHCAVCKWCSMTTQDIAGHIKRCAAPKYTEEGALYFVPKPCTALQKTDKPHPFPPDTYRRSRLENDYKAALAKGAVLVEEHTYTPPPPKPMSNALLAMKDAATHANILFADSIPAKTIDPIPMIKAVALKRLQCPVAWVDPPVARRVKDTMPQIRLSDLEKVMVKDILDPLQTKERHAAQITEELQKDIDAFKRGVN